MAKTYDLSLIPSLQEQVAFYRTAHHELREHASGAYQSFLDFIDGKSEELANDPAYEHLQQVYERASDRMNALMGALDQEQEYIDFWDKKLNEIAISNDAAQWQEMAVELIEQGDYRANAQEFKTGISAEVAGLQQELTELLDDWRGCVEQGEIAELAYLLEALDDNEQNDEPDPLDMLFGEQDDEQADGQAPRGGCCGRQTPCCQETDEEPKQGCCRSK